MKEVILPHYIQQEGILNLILNSLLISKIIQHIIMFFILWPKT